MVKQLPGESASHGNDRGLKGQVQPCNYISLEVHKEEIVEV